MYYKISVISLLVLDPTTHHHPPSADSLPSREKRYRGQVTINHHYHCSSSCGSYLSELLLLLLVVTTWLDFWGTTTSSQVPRMISSTTPCYYPSQFTCLEYPFPLQGMWSEVRVTTLNMEAAACWNLNFAHPCLVTLLLCCCAAVLCGS